MAGNNKTQIASEPILFDPKLHQHLLPSFAAIHSACIMTDHSVITFLPPLSDSVILDWYSDRSKEVTDGTKLIVMQLAERKGEVRVGGGQVIAGPSLTSGRSGESGELTAGDEEQSKIKSEVGKEELVGFVMLVMNAAETGPFRAPVEKLLISPEWRRMGVAKRLMAALETIAMEKGKTLMLLDTEVGSPAELIYPRLGYTAMGTIPRYSISPLDGSLKDEIFFYKHLTPLNVVDKVN